jgi:hypothetical protein
VLVVAGAFAVGLRTARYRPEAVRADNAATDGACLSCHRQEASFEKTAHHLTSSLPTRADIEGSFSSGQNVLRTSNPSLHFRMDSTAAGFYETAIFGRAPDTSSRSERIDIVTGSGRRGQSYLYWRGGDHLYQLPVSYWTMLGWANSPAYPDGRANFDRAIPPRCLECHAAGFKSVAEPNVFNHYQRTGVMLGVMCETCHGSGQEHVARERSLLRAVLAPAIINPARLPRARRLDGCALCHGGAAAPRTAAFSYVPGQPLVKDVNLWARPDTGEVDVHGDQVGLLERSKCFRSSQMTCSTCHDVHRQQHDLVALSGRCLTCHTAQSCGLFPSHGQSLVGRCVSCHMPSLPSTTVIANYLGHQVRQQVRSHWIKVYPQFQLTGTLRSQPRGKHRPRTPPYSPRRNASGSHR